MKTVYRGCFVWNGELNIFGGGERTINSDNFKGGKITCVFGGSSIDMLSAKLAPGNNVIDVFTVFGGSKLIIPSDWDIKLDVVAIFGGFSDKRRNITTSSEGDSRLIIKGIASTDKSDLRLSDVQFCGINEKFYDIANADYTNLSDEEVIIDIKATMEDITDLETKEKEIDTKLNGFLKSLGF